MTYKVIFHPSAQWFSQSFIQYIVLYDQTKKSDVLFQLSMEFKKSESYLAARIITPEKYKKLVTAGIIPDDKKYRY